MCRGCVHVEQACNFDKNLPGTPTRMIPLGRKKTTDPTCSSSVFASHRVHILISTNIKWDDEQTNDLTRNSNPLHYTLRMMASQMPKEQLHRVQAFSESSALPPRGKSHIHGCLK